MLERKRRRNAERDKEILEVKVHFLQEEVENLRTQVDELSTEERKVWLEKLQQHPNHKKKHKRKNRRK